MSKVTLTDITTAFGSKEAINTNNQTIETAFDNTLSRDGTTPNQLEADIDLNSNDLLNVKETHTDELYLDGVKVTTEAPVVDGNIVGDTVSDTDGNVRSGRKNLLINGNFDIWQRGTSFSGGGQYTADRLAISSNNIALTRSTDVPTTGSNYSAQVVSSGGLNAACRVSVELVDQLPSIFTVGKTLTLSFYVKGEVGEAINIRSAFAVDTSVNGAFGSGGEDLAETTIGVGTGVWEKYTYTWDLSITAPALSNAYVVLIKQAATDSTFLLAQVQLEEGSVATDFEYRPIAEELALCQRYFERLGAPSSGASVLGNFNYSTSSVCTGMLTFSEKRNNPTMSYSGTGWTLQGGDASETFSSFVFSSEQPKTTRVQWVDSGTPFVTGDSLILAANSPSDYIDIDAEL